MPHQYTFRTRRPRVECVCQQCQQPFRVMQYKLEQGGGRYCSRVCSGHAHRLTLAERFWNHVRKTDTCWVWTGRLNNMGYGEVSARREYGRTALAHRVSWELHHGPIPPGQNVCHQCDTPRCVNPEHLFLGSQADNLRDASRKGRVRNAVGICPEVIPRGVEHHAAKLNPDAIRAIRARRTQGASRSTIAREFGVAVGTVGDIIAGRTWKHVD